MATRTSNGCPSQTFFAVLTMSSAPFPHNSSESIFILHRSTLVSQDKPELPSWKYPIQMVFRARGTGKLPSVERWLRVAVESGLDCRKATAKNRLEFNTDEVKTMNLTIVSYQAVQRSTWRHAAGVAVHYRWRHWGHEWTTSDQDAYRAVLLIMSGTSRKSNTIDG